MKCKEALDKYIALDNNELVPFAVTFHLLRCRQCRKIVRAMTSAANLYSKKISEAGNANVSETANNDIITDKSNTTAKDFRTNKTLTQKTMEKINIAVPDLMIIQAEKNNLPEVNLLPWIIVGVIMILGFASIPFTTLGRWAVLVFKLNFTIPFALIFSIFVTIYCALFVGRNLDFFIKKFDLK